MTTEFTAAQAREVAQPGTDKMPRWNVGELDPPPHFTRRNWTAMIGPGVLMAGAAIGSGEWLLGPAVTARYGGALLWLATLSIAGQFIYNVEVSRYTLYTGEPVMTGKFRLLPGPVFWLFLYLALDFGAILPYQIANVTTTVAAVFMGQIPDPERVPAHASLLKILTYIMVVVALVPLIFGGKVYNSLKAVMSFKIVVVLGFLSFLALFYSSAGTWGEILVGFFRFGTIPVEGSTVDNVFLSLWRGDGLPSMDRNALPLLTSFAAIAGVGGLAQMTISNATREQGWGMGRHVGAIPSLIGGRDIQLSHVGTVFRVTPESLQRWKGWYRHVLRDQLAIWVPGAFIGLALPSMLSVEFLPRGTVAGQWVLAGMTAGGVQERVGGALGNFFWHMVLFCGFLVLMPSIAANADGFIRRWLDACWTSMRALRRLDPHHIRWLYFIMLTAYIAIAFIFLSVARPMWLIVAYANLGNFALGFSCWHTLAVNLKLLPPELRPGWVSRISLALAGLYFFVLAILTGLVALGWI